MIPAVIGFVNVHGKQSANARYVRGNESLAMRVEIDEVVRRRGSLILNQDDEQPGNALAYGREEATPTEALRTIRGASNFVR